MSCLGDKRTQHLIDNLQKTSPKVVEELIPGLMTIGAVQQVLVHLLREQISVRDLKTILETLADWAGNVKNPERLADYVRRRFSRVITAKHQTTEGVLPLVSMSPQLERILGDSLQQTDEGSFLAMDPSVAQLLINKLARASERFAEIGQTPVLLAPSHLRAAIFRFADRFAPGFSVISHHEIASTTKVQSLGVLTIDDQLATSAPRAVPQQVEA